MKRPTATLAYAAPSLDTLGMADYGLICAMVACGLAAAFCLLLTYIHATHIQFTPQYVQYNEAQLLQRAINPSSTPPPFTGQQYVAQNVWQYFSTYGVVLFPAAALGLYWFGYRPRRPGRAG